MIGLSSQLFDLNGHTTLQKIQSSSTPPLTRRTTKTATLDGNNVVSDFGYSPSDGSWVIKTNDRGSIPVLENLIKNHSKVILSSKQGAFVGVISQLDLITTPIEITFLAESLVS